MPRTIPDAGSPSLNRSPYDLEPCPMPGEYLSPKPWNADCGMPHPHPNHRRSGNPSMNKRRPLPLDCHAIV